MSDKDTFSRAIAANNAWASQTASSDPALFKALAAGQSPEILWIGCSDSRVPETTLLGLKPGDVFVHRNIANVLHPADLNSASVIEYAVEHLHVKHIILCGHTACGGVNAVLGNARLGPIDAWLLPLRALRCQHLDCLAELPSDAERGLKLVELNVRQGVRTLKSYPNVIDAMRDRGLKVHGMVYNVGTGHVQELDTSESVDEVARRLAAFEAS
ncbi:MAG: hypothetical protein M1819_005589 [Sarea resinae]|nr:MAG: hypothetical protein M1819_005589 [Sarea resinae]